MKTKAYPPIEQHRKDLIDKIKQLGQTHSIWNVYEDFLALSAISISNAVDHFHFEKREKMYFDLIKKYSKQELDLFPSMLADLVMELEKFSESPRDVLGEIFHELELHNKYKGQFFTPNHISEFMGEVTLQGNNNAIEENEYVTIYEPCAGSGTLILGFANAMNRNGYDAQKQLLVTAVDIDIKCVHMTYLQLSLYGIPAIVVHGNSLTVEEWSHWYTPMYLMNGWQFKEKALTEPVTPTAPAQVTTPPIILNTKSNGQFSFF